MPLPLPLDPDFRIEVVESWLDDFLDRVQMGDHHAAEYSLSVATQVYLSLPPGRGHEDIERRICKGRVKLEHLQP
jgi:hypothetical protein